MMTLNIALQQEQQQRESNNLVVSREQIQEEAEQNTSLYSMGSFDGVIGRDPDPEKWGEYAYRSGFLSGVTRYYDQKYQMS